MSSVIVSLIALSALAPPNCSITMSGCSAWTAAVAARVGSTLSLASIESPAIVKLTSAAWPSAVTSVCAVERRLQVLDVRDLREAAR